MKSVLSTLLLMIVAVAVKSQTIEDGTQHLFAERYKSAEDVFNKIIESKPKDELAWYWLGQVYIKKQDYEKARDSYTKGLTANPKAQILNVGLGELDLIQKKQDEALQKFEAAITETHTKKGDNPNILMAVGRAITNSYSPKEKNANIDYAVAKLEEAAKADPGNPYVQLALSDAYLKAKPGENGGAAVQSLNKVILMRPNFGIANYKLAQIYKTQKNWNVFEDNLKRSIEANPKFAPAYYEYWYYLLQRQKFNEAEGFAQKYLENADPDPLNEYVKAQTLFFNKKYSDAIDLANGMRSRLGHKTFPKVEKLLAYSYLESGDTAKARPFIDNYFASQTVDELGPKDFALKADIYSAIPNSDKIVFDAITDGVNIDTSLDGKLDVLKSAAISFKSRKQHANECKIHEMIFKLKRNLSLNDYFYAGLANYYTGNYVRSREIFSTLVEKFPAEQYGWEWKFRNSSIIDKANQDSIALPDALALLKFCEGDTVKYKNNISETLRFLAIFYYDKKKDYISSVSYFKRLLYYVSEDQKATFQGYIDQLTPAAELQAKEAAKNASNIPAKPGGGPKKD